MSPPSPLGSRVAEAGGAAVEGAGEEEEEGEGGRRDAEDVSTRARRVNVRRLVCMFDEGCMVVSVGAVVLRVRWAGEALQICWKE